MLLTAMLWGAGFIGTQMALDSGFSPGLFLSSRFAIASVILLVIGIKKIFPLCKQDVLYSFISGFLLFLGSYLQTIGLTFTTPSNNGFFTSVYVIIVPLIAWVLHRKRPPFKLWVCCLIALAGLIALSYQQDTGFTINVGDMLTLLSAFLFACHYASLGIISPKVETLKLTFLQLAFVAAASFICMLIFEPGSTERADWSAGWMPVLFHAVFPTCLCFFMQFWAQARTSSSKAAIILSGEAFWCAAFSVIVGYELFSAQMVIGGLLIVGAIILLEVKTPDFKRKP